MGDHVPDRRSAGASTRGGQSARASSEREHAQASKLNSAENILLNLITLTNILQQHSGFSSGCQRNIVYIVKRAMYIAER